MSVAICLPPGIIKREATVKFAIRYAFISRTRTIQNKRSVLQSGALLSRQPLLSPRLTAKQSPGN